MKKMITTILIVLAGIIAFVLIAALFVKKTYIAQGEIIINKPKQEVFDYIKLTKNQDYYSKWVMTDPNMKKTFTGTDGTVGFIYAWDGNKKAGAGEQEIIGIKEGEREDIEVRFKRPFEGVAKMFLSTDSIAPDQTKVIWSSTGGNPYPLNLMHLFIEGMLSKDIETSLVTLKGILEKK